MLKRILAKIKQLFHTRRCAGLDCDGLLQYSSQLAMTNQRTVICLCYVE